MADLDLEPIRATQRGRHRRSTLASELPCRAALTAVKVPVLGRRQDVELLAPVRIVAVTHEAELLEHVERPVHRRRDGRPIARSASLDEIGAGDVAVGPRKDLDHGPALRRPAQTATAKLITNRAPRLRQGLDRGHRR